MSRPSPFALVRSFALAWVALFAVGAPALAQGPASALGAPLPTAPDTALSPAHVQQAAPERGRQGGPLRVSAGLGFSAGVLPGPVTGHLTLRGRLRLGPIAIVGAGWVSDEARQEVPGSRRGQASLRWLGASIGVCPLSLELEGGRIDACALLGVGAVVGRGEALPSDDLGTSLFTSLETSVRGSVALHGPVYGWASVSGGGVVARPRHTVNWDGHVTTVHQSAPWVIHFESGLGFLLSSGAAGGS